MHTVLLKLTVDCEVGCKECLAILSEIPIHRVWTSSVQRVSLTILGATEQQIFSLPEADKQDYPSFIVLWRAKEFIYVREFVAEIDLTNIIVIMLQLKVSISLQMNKQWIK